MYRNIKTISSHIEQDTAHSHFIGACETNADDLSSATYGQELVIVLEQEKTERKPGKPRG